MPKTSNKSKVKQLIKEYASTPNKTHKRRISLLDRIKNLVIKNES